MQIDKITPCLWFDANAEDAVRFYTGIFPESGIDTITNYGKAGPGQEGTVMFITFHLNGQPFMALNGGPFFNFTPAISLHVGCKTQAEIDTLWEKLSDGGEVDQCGWLKDQFGVSWQIDSADLMRMMLDPDEEKVERVTRAMLQMVKLDIATLERAYEGNNSI